MQTLYLIRHGQTAWNAQRRFQGQADVPLDTTGLGQAARLADRLADAGLDALYASDLSRARTTAEAVAARTGLELRIDPRLREVHVGQWEGYFVDEMDAVHPDWRTILNGPRMGEFGGETRQQVRDRYVDAVRDIGAAHPGATVAIVGHGFALGALVSHLLGLPDDPRPEGSPRGNTAVAIFEDPLTAPRLVLGNCTRHLDA